MNLKEKLTELTEALIAGSELFIVDILIAGTSAKTMKVSVLLDSDAGISIEECVKISRKLGLQIEEQSLIESAYVLEVSSPGIEEPLKLLRQYTKNVGRNLAVTLTDNSQKKGLLKASGDSSIILSISDKKRRKFKI